ncbi:deoxyribodipyrimidine photo-lyase [Endozoicomonas sp. OPT23]|uniref:deoxyribodipyrimidine photo-lyase n=1 Tax=Endozoicomonas sp. OPT23 TaxID=2072845 RepID=UPI00129AB6C3|nr:deoxyribodipyrimidine photo-lyase [Endozoicomonas sp. OPT23]MRI33571.1 deoxyribodipyrimidine photo-lyase [Endozoicomonas sp. OPT23]
MTQQTLVWFRNDLRVHDNPALYSACQESQVIAVYLTFSEQWQTHNESNNKLWFAMQNLQELEQNLKALNIPLIVLKADSFDKASGMLLKLAKQLSCTGISWNDKYGLNEELRDTEVERAFADSGLNCRRHNDQTLFRPGTVRNGKGEYFKVFTPFKKALYRQLQIEQLNCSPAPDKQEVVTEKLPKSVNYIDLYQPLSEQVKELWSVGEDAAHERLTDFIEEKSEDYKNFRDFPDRPYTSTISPYLATGVLSVRQCFHAACMANQGELDTGNDGLQCWMSELIWREFYRHILHGFPRLSKHRAFVEHTEKLPWSNNESNFQAWCEGRTGYPLVDAAMKQLLATGWMHNRLRMVSAMFLTKNLMIDWRKGEAFFMQHLIDGDFASNNGGWQWSASTGTDAAPYFRMFNPVNQSEKFDPKGSFIRKWLPELVSLNDKQIHAPWQHNFDINYPEPVVDHAESRKEVLAAFKALK